ncbi:MAG: NAD-dependent epimerase/dehydratase family protein [Methanoregula sp.]
MKSPIIQDDIKYIIDSNIPLNDLAGKNILITGANGMLPSYIVETILFLNDTQFKNKVKIFAVVRSIEKAQYRFNGYLTRQDLVFIIQDITSPLVISEKIDYIIHAASNASPSFFGTDPVGTLLPNTIGTYNCLEFARKNDITSFLFFSSSEVYGAVENSNKPINENSFGNIDPTIMRSCYSESKRMGETMCIAWHKQYGVPTKIIRPFHTYGPNMQLNDGRVFADFVSDIIQKKDIILKSDGSAKRTFCYLSDATIAYFLVLLNGQAGEAYNVGGNEKFEMSILELAQTLVALFPEYKLKIIKNINRSDEGYIQSKISRSIPDISKIQKLGWIPKISIADGFQRTVESFL